MKNKQHRGSQPKFNANKNRLRKSKVGSSGVGKRKQVTRND